MKQMTIQSINYEDDHISIFFDRDWFQEDIVTLRQLILDQISNHQIREIIEGADRENIRFIWLHTDFILNFDYYSQSCWINTHDEISVPKIQRLFDLLIKRQYPHV